MVLFPLLPQEQRPGPLFYNDMCRGQNKLSARCRLLQAYAALSSLSRKRKPHAEIPERAVDHRAELMNPLRLQRER